MNAIAAATLISGEKWETQQWQRQKSALKQLRRKRNASEKWRTISHIYPTCCFFLFPFRVGFADCVDSMLLFHLLLSACWIQCETHIGPAFSAHNIHTRTGQSDKIEKQITQVNMTTSKLNLSKILPNILLLKWKNCSN